MWDFLSFMTFDDFLKFHDFPWLFHKKIIFPGFPDPLGTLIHIAKTHRKPAGIARWQPYNCCYICKYLSESVWCYNINSTNPICNIKNKYLFHTQDIFTKAMHTYTQISIPFSNNTSKNYILADLTHWYDQLCARNADLEHGWVIIALG